MRLREDDEAALEALYERHWAPLVRHIAGFVGSRDGAEDIAQEAFVRVWARRARWRPQSAGALLHRIGRNLALDERRRRRVRRRWSRQERTPSAPSPLELVECRDALDAVWAAVAELPRRRREVFRLSRKNGLTYREIAERLEISPQTVANQMSSALAHLRRALLRYREA